MQLLLLWSDGSNGISFLLGLQLRDLKGTGNTVVLLDGASSQISIVLLVLNRLGVALRVGLHVVVLRVHEVLVPQVLVVRIQQVVVSLLNLALQVLGLVCRQFRGDGVRRVAKSRDGLEQRVSLHDRGSCHKLRVVDHFALDVLIDWRSWLRFRLWIQNSIERRDRGFEGRISALGEVIVLATGRILPISLSLSLSGSFSLLLKSMSKESLVYETLVERTAEVLVS